MRLRLTVAVSTKLNRGHLVHGKEALILPCLGAQRYRCPGGVGRQSRSRTACRWCTASSGLEPPSKHLRSEVAIVCGMAKATLPACGIDWDSFAADYERIRDKIEEVFPTSLPISTSDSEAVRFPSRQPATAANWNTATGRANFMVFPGIDEDPVVSDPSMLRLATLRSHDQYNSTIYSLDDRYRGVFGGRMVAFANEADMQARGFHSDLIEMETLAGDGRRRIVGGFRSSLTASRRLDRCVPETNLLLPPPHPTRGAARLPPSRFRSSFADKAREQGLTTEARRRPESIAPNHKYAVPRSLPLLRAQHSQQQASGRPS